MKLYLWVFVSMTNIGWKRFLISLRVVFLGINLTFMNIDLVDYAIVDHYCALHYFSLPMFYPIKPSMIYNEENDDSHPDYYI